MIDAATLRLRVLVIDDHMLFADVIRSALEGVGMEVLGPAGTGHDGVTSARRDRPDLILVDLGLPDISGLSVGQQILEELPTARVIALGSLSDPKAVREALRLGFHGYITKDVPVREFLSSVRAVLAGQVVVPRVLARAVSGARSGGRERAAPLISPLTPREHQVLQLLAEGLGGSEIAKRLSINPRTVRSYVQNVLVKLQVHSRLEAAAFAVRHGLVTSARRHAQR